MFDSLMFKQFDVRTYNCWHLVRDAWQIVTGVDLGLPDLTRYSATEFNEVSLHWSTTRYREIEKAQSPCIVLLTKGKHMPHVGLFWGGRVLHIRQSGVQNQPIDVVAWGYDSRKFYVPCA
jgi:hypothetical protein